MKKIGVIVLATIALTLTLPSCEDQENKSHTTYTVIQDNVKTEHLEHCPYYGGQYGRSFFKDSNGKLYVYYGTFRVMEE